MRLSFRIALRFLNSNKGQTLLIALGIAVGISVQIFIGSLIEGLQKSLIDATIGNASHITLVSKEKSEPIKEYKAIIEKLKNQNNTFTAISPSLAGGAFLKNSDLTEQTLIKGFYFPDANKIYKLDQNLVKGKLPQMDEIMIGLDFSKENTMDINDAVEIVTADGRSHQAKISGIFDLKVASINQSWSIVSLDFAQKLLNYEANWVTSIETQINSPFEADALSENLQLSLNSFGINAKDWKSQNQQLLSGLDGQSYSSLMIQVFVVISVVLGIASVLAISVLQKSKQLGILKAMGITDRGASQVFLFQGFILGILGGILGILLGLGLLFSFTSFALKPDGSPVVPLLINYHFMIFSGFLAVLASTLAAIVPAAKSKKLSPMEVIKNG